ncbi:MAG: hypothetical protein WBP42_02540 [Candidatus Zixiibacteriota bacterium]
MISQSEINAALRDLGSSTPTARRRLAAKSIKFYAAYYLGLSLWACQKAWFEELREITKGGIVGPPDSGKTEVIARLVPLRTITFNRNIRICYISSTGDLSEASGSVLRQDLENERIVEDFGPFRTSKYWSDRRFQVRRDLNAKERTFEAYGMDSKRFYGKHYDLILLDDIQNDLNVRSDKTRKFHVHMFQNAIRTRLVPGGRLLILANKQHPKDIYTHIGSLADYHMIISKALIDDPGPEHYKIVELPRHEINEFGDRSKWRVDVDPKFPGKALTEERYPVKRLIALRREIGTVAFNLKYQQEASDDVSALISRDDLKACCDETISYGVYDRSKFIGIISGCDPALVTDKKRAEKNDTDFFVNMTWGIAENEHRYVLDIFRDRGMSPKTVKSTIVNQSRLHRPNRMFFEENAFGEIYSWHIKEETGVPIKKHYTGGNKHDPFAGYPSLSVLCENRQIHFPYKTDHDKEITDNLIEELHDPTACDHDDQLSAAWITERGVQWFLRYIERAGHVSQVKVKTEPTVPVELATQPTVKKRIRKQPAGITLI